MGLGPAARDGSLSPAARPSPQAVLKRGLKPGCTVLPLMRKDHPDNLLFLLGSLGRLHLAGWVCAPPGPRGPRLPRDGRPGSHLGLWVLGEVTGSGGDGWGSQGQVRPSPAPHPQHRPQPQRPVPA